MQHTSINNNVKNNEVTSIEIIKTTFFDLSSDCYQSNFFKLIKVQEKQKKILEPNWTYPYIHTINTLHILPFC